MPEEYARDHKQHQSCFAQAFLTCAFQVLDHAHAARGAANMGHPEKVEQTPEGEYHTSAARFGTVEERSSELTRGGKFLRVV
jgi:hypothetical protein